MKKIERFNVLSLFDGGSMSYPALVGAGVPKEAIKYYAVEIDKFARQVGDARVPNIIRPANDVRLISGYSYPRVDLLIGGSPCQDLSIAGKGKGLAGDRSGLFWEWLRIKTESLPEYWLLENVASMKKMDRDTITEALGVEPIRIESELVSAQKRSRLYWTNIPDVTQPDDCKIDLAEIVEDGWVDRQKSYAVDANYFKGTNAKQYLTKKRRQIVFTATDSGLSSNFRMMTPLECERLQTLPEGWTDVGLSNTQRYKVIGNGFTVKVIEHILSHIPELK